MKGERWKRDSRAFKIQVTFLWASDDILNVMMQDDICMGIVTTH